MEAFMLLQFAVSTASSFYSSIQDVRKNGSGLQQDVCQLTKKIQDYTDKYNEVLRQNAEIQSELALQLNADILAINSMSILAKGKLKAHTDNFQLVQKFSVILLVLLIAILLFKAVGIVKIVNDFLKKMFISFIGLFKKV
jgi:hypothetical protein